MLTTTLARMQPARVTDSTISDSQIATRLVQSIGYVGLAEAQARTPTEADGYRSKVLGFLHEQDWMPYDARSVFKYQQEQILAMKASEKPHDAVTTKSSLGLSYGLKKQIAGETPSLSENAREKKRALELRQFFTHAVQVASQMRDFETKQGSELQRIFNTIESLLCKEKDGVKNGTSSRKTHLVEYAVGVDNAGLIFPWQWVEVPLKLYGLPVPLPVLEHVEKISKAFSKAEFFVEHLTDRDPRRLLSQPLLEALSNQVKETYDKFVTEYYAWRAREQKIADAERERQRKLDYAARALRAKVVEEQQKRLRNTAIKVKQRKLKLSDINFEEHGVTQQQVHWYLYDPFLKMRLHYGEAGEYEDLYLFVWDEPDFQATILD